jgi:hypothetical protein
MGLVFDWGGFGGEADPCGGANGAHHGSLGHRPGCARPPIPSPEGAEQRVSPLQGSGGFCFLPGAMPQAVVRGPDGAGF